MKKAFTLSEVLISLAIIGVISAILIPVLNNVRPDKERILYKKAMYTLQNAISTALNDNSEKVANSAAYWGDSTTDSTAFCADVAGALNVVGTINCGITGSSTSPNFVTVNGSKWWGLGGDKFTQSGSNMSKVITVDVDGNNGKNSDGVDQLKIKVRFDGKVSTDSSWSTENEYLSNAMKIAK